MNGESTTLCAAQEQEKLLFVQLFRTTVCFIFTPLHFLISVYRLWQRMYVLGSFEPWTKFRLQGRFLRRYVMCVTAASVKSESQRKQAIKQNLDPLFLRETGQLLAAAAWRYLCDFRLKVSVLETSTT